MLSQVQFGVNNLCHQRAFRSRLRLDGAVTVFVGVQLFVRGLYRPPVFRGEPKLFPPHTTMAVPVQMTV